MANSDGKRKDGGISDVLVAVDKNETKFKQQKEEISEINGISENNDYSDKPMKKLSNESTGSNNSSENARNSETLQNDINKEQIDNKTETEMSAVPNGDDKTSAQSGFTGELDLADPDSVIHMLENVDLTEEDTENLLQEAYNMNRKLKEMLRHQELDSKSSKPKLKSKLKSSKISMGGNSHNSASSSGDNSRIGSSFAIRKVLPPIHAGENETSVYAIKLRRSKTSITEVGPTLSDTAMMRSRSSTKKVIYIGPTIFLFSMEYRTHSGCRWMKTCFPRQT